MHAASRHHDLRGRAAHALLGTHLNATYTPMGGAAITLTDLDYSFDDQKFRTITPVVTSPKGKYIVTCTYDNECVSATERLDLWHGNSVTSFRWRRAPDAPTL